MTSIRTGKASAACGSPGFFHFVIYGCAALYALSVAAAQESRPVGSISITGNESIPTSTVLGWMETKPGSRFVQTDTERIISGYASEGFLFVRVGSVRFVPVADSSTVGLVLTIREGKRVVVSSVQMDGLKSLDEREIGEFMGTRAGGKFVPAVLEQDIGMLLQLYEKSGYPFARIEIQDIRFDESEDSLGAAITLSIDEGAQAKIQNLRVEGNTTTKTAVITREARLTEGEIFRGDQPLRVKQRLERMQLFSSVSMPALYLNPDGSVGLSLKVTEGNPNRFDGIVGYVPSGVPGAGGYLTGLVDVQFRNILGTGRKLSARWYRETETSQEIELRYREPWIASLPLNAEAGFAQRKQDSTYIRNSYTLSAELMATDELNVGAVFSSERVLPTEGYGVRVANESRTTSVGLSVFYDSRNDPVTPTGGIKYRTEYRTGIKEIQTPIGQPSGNRSSTQSFSFEFEYLFSPIQRQVLSASLSARDFRSGGIELSDMFRLGGSNSLRGYREGQFLGSRIVWSNLEYRLLTDQRSYAFGFVDFGYVLSPDRPQAGLVKQEIHKVGYGAGVRLDTPLGLIGVSLGFGEGDTFSTAKLHIRLINEF